MTSHEIHRLNFGSVRVDASMLVRGRPPGTMVEVPAQGYLITGNHAPILVDAGYRDPEVLGSGGHVTTGQGFTEQLSAYGITPGDLACVIPTHLHRDHAGHLDKVPMSVPVVVNRAELSCAFSNIQGTAYARDDLLHVVRRMYTPGALRVLDLVPNTRATIMPGIVVVGSGGHTAGSVNIEVDTREGTAALIGDLLYDLHGSLHETPHGTPMAGVQSYTFAVDEPAPTNNFTPSVADEIRAIKQVLMHRYLLPAHDRPGVLETGRLVGRIDGPTVPGPITPLPIETTH
ncbi:MBL fold metallo-hydrolase [Intrasporangium sp. DVR]|uniref:MBL fold metallo-hydrolase n=1 Tax=Intrasporangium sp. DVR TaxID=3127867 RepID=UPI00313A6251